MSETTMNPSSPTESSAKRKAALWVAIVFVLGVALGGVFGYFYAGRVNAAPRSPQLTEPQRRAARVAQLTKELDLTPDQQRQLDSTLERLHTEYKELREQNDVRMNDARQKGRDQLRALLTPEQKPKFEEFLRRLDEERKRNTPSQPPSH